MRKPLNDLPYNQRLQPTRAYGPARLSLVVRGAYAA